MNDRCSREIGSASVGHSFVLSISSASFIADCVTGHSSKKHRSSTTWNYKTCRDVHFNSWDVSSPFDATSLSILSFELRCLPGWRVLIQAEDYLTGLTIDEPGNRWIFPYCGSSTRTVSAINNQLFLKVISCFLFGIDELTVSLLINLRNRLGGIIWYRIV